MNYPQNFASITDEQLSIDCAKSLNDFVFNVNTYKDKSFSASKRKIIEKFDVAIDVYYSQGKALGFPILNSSLLLIIFKAEIAKSNSPIISRVRQPASRPLLEESNYDEKRCYINKNLHIFDFITMNLANLLKNDLSPSYSPVFIATEPDRLYIETSYANGSFESKNLDRMNQFLSSRYTLNLIEKFGPKLIFDITRNRIREFVPLFEWKK